MHVIGMCQILIADRPGVGEASSRTFEETVHYSGEKLIAGVRVGRTAFVKITRHQHDQSHPAS